MGFRDSGTMVQGHLLNPSFHGAAWLTGGTVGPEGSVLVFVVIAGDVLWRCIWRFRGMPRRLTRLCPCGEVTPDNSVRPTLASLELLLLGRFWQLRFLPGFGKRIRRRRRHRLVGL